MTQRQILGVNRNRRSEKKILQIQRARAGYYILQSMIVNQIGSFGLWVVSTVSLSCPQDSASHLLLVLAVLLMKSSYLLKVSCCFCQIINHQCCHFSAIRLNTGIFLDWPIREILSLCFLPNRTSTKVSLFCYSARYRYPYFQVQIEMANTGNRLFQGWCTEKITFFVIASHKCRLCNQVEGLCGSNSPKYERKRPIIKEDIAFLVYDF